MGNFSWEKLGKFSIGLLTAISAIAAIYATFIISRPANLTAELTYDYQILPQQFLERLVKANEKLSYKTLYDQIRTISEGNLDHQKIDAIAVYANESYFSIYDEPFIKGPQQYNLRLFISIQNSSNKVAKDIVVNLPKPALILVEDETGKYLVQNQLIPSVKLATIGPSNHSKVWAYFVGDMKEHMAEPVRISHADGVADIYINESFNGFDATIARNSTIVMLLLSALFVFSVACFFLLIFSSTNQVDSKK